MILQMKACKASNYWSHEAAKLETCIHYCYEGEIKAIEFEAANFVIF